MDDKHSASSWDDLIKQVGAAPAPDALERKRSAIETTFEPPPAIDPAAVKAKPGDWNALANKLGIDPVEPAEPSGRRSKGSRDSDYGGPSSEALEASLAEIEPMESMFEEIIEEEVADVEFEAEDSELDDSDVSDSSMFEGDDSDLADETDADDDAPETLTGDAARTAFDALFEVGSFDALPTQPSPARAPRTAPGPQWRDADAKRPEPSSARSDDSRRDSADDGEGDGASAASGDDSTRPRRRRRRGRGRGRDGASRGDRPGERRTPTRAEDEAAGWAEAQQGEDAEDDDAERSEESVAEGERPARRRRVRRRRRRGAGGEAAEGGAERAAGNGRSREPADDEDDEPAMVESSGIVGDEVDDEDGDDLPRESHKNIPTWAEAISVMVDANMQSRKNSPSRPSGSRERGRGRGRGRGGSGRRGSKP